MIVPIFIHKEKSLNWQFFLKLRQLFKNKYLFFCANFTFWGHLSCTCFSLSTVYNPIMNSFTFFLLIEEPVIFSLHSFYHSISLLFRIHFISSSRTMISCSFVEPAVSYLRAFLSPLGCPSTFLYSPPHFPSFHHSSSVLNPEPHSVPSSVLPPTPGLRLEPSELLLTAGEVGFALASQDFRISFPASYTSLYFQLLLCRNIS